MSWCLGHLDTGDIYLKGGGLMHGSVVSQAAYRSKAGGLLACVTTLSLLTCFLKITQPFLIIVACDGESALYSSMKSQFSSRHKQKDIISRIQYQRSTLTASVHPVHVYGHQDDKGSPLSMLETLNV